MVIFKNTDITVYNKYTDKITGTEKYQRTIIYGVNWQAERNVNVNNKSVDVYYTTIIFVNKLPNYIGPKAFKKLNDANRPNFFTFGVSDLVVKGAITTEITKATDFNNIDNVVNIAGVKELPEHWEVEGV